jgi:hypothetical protein
MMCDLGHCCFVTQVTDDVARVLNSMMQQHTMHN